MIVQLSLGNDVYVTSWHLQGGPKAPREPYFVFEKDGSLRQLDFQPRRFGTDDPLADRLRRHTLLWNVFETGVLYKLKPPGEDDPDEVQNRFNLNKMIVHSTRSSERLDQAWKVTVALLQRIREYGDQRGIKTALVVAPAMFQVYDDDWDALIKDNKLRRDDWSPDAPNRYLAARAAEVGMPMLDLLPAFRAEAARSGVPLYFARDRHWTPAGHALAAREVAQYLAAQGLAP